jgi:SHS2 domain-containing protein
MRVPAPGEAPLFSEIEHTGDVGILVHAPDLRGLFEKCALALYTLMIEPDGIEARDQRDIEVTGDAAGGLAGLLHAWLSELLVLFFLDGVVASEVLVEEVGPIRVRGQLRGETLDIERHTFRGEIKAVTRHALTVSEREGGWAARVIFDV